MHICRYLIITIFLITSLIANADDTTAVENAVKDEFGSCYKQFKSDLETCNASTCLHPDFADAKAWKAHVIRGKVYDQCYVIYYSYIGNNIIGKPEHCFYSTDQLKYITQLYDILFKTNSANDVTEAKTKIDQLNQQICKDK